MHEALLLELHGEAIATALGHCERALSYFTEATRQGTHYDSYWNDLLFAPIAKCTAFKGFMKPKD